MKYSYFIINENNYKKYILTCKNSINNLLYEIDNDNLQEINNDKYNQLINYCKDKLNNYIQKYKNIKLKNDLNKISRYLVFIMILFYEKEFIFEMDYSEIKKQLNQFNYEIYDINNIEIFDWNTLIIRDNKINNYISFKDISMITFTNYGYIEYTKNLIISLKRCEFPISLKIYTLDEKSYYELENLNENIIIELFNDENNHNENIIEYKKNKWNEMMFSKIKIIYEELQNNKYVFYTDSDIVFENKRCLNYLINNINNNELLIQKNKNDILCAGFMFLKSNKNTLNFFNYNTIKYDTFVCDEDYLNENKEKIKYKTLRRELFPIQRYYEKYLNDYYIIHFNINTGYDKISCMKKYNKWYL